MSITELSIKRPSLVIVVFLTLTVLGFFSYTKLSYELIPKFSAPFVLINTVYPGASPSEVENSVTKVIEDAVSNMERVVSVRGTSFESLSFVFIEMEDGVDIDKAIQDAQRNINADLNKLPNDVQPPSLSKWASDEFPILNLGASSNLDDSKFYDLIIDQVKPAISSVQGVSEVSIIGGQEREVQVSVNQQSLEARGLTILQVVQAIQQANLDFPTGKIESADQQMIVRLSGKFEGIGEMHSLVVANDPRTGAPIKLAEIAEVRDSKKDLVSLSRTDGKSAIGIRMLKSPDANAVAVAAGVLEKMERLKTQFAAQQLDFKIANNQTEFTIAAVDAVTHDLLLAIVLVAVVMLFFLHSIRNALIVMLAIPTSLVATLIMMYLCNFTLNLMTLLAMSLVIGILVDDSIVVLENIYRYLEKGYPRKEAALLGRNEIAFTALSITLVDVVVFVPIAMAGGIVGKIMSSFALVVTFSTLMSLFVSFTLTPMLASRFSRLEKYGDRSLAGLVFNGFERMLTRLNNWYGRVISRIISPIRIPVGGRSFNLYLNGILVLVLTAVAFVSSFSLVTNGYIGSAFVTPGDRGEFILKLELPKDATLYETNLASQKAEQFLLLQKEITGVFTTVGQVSGALGSQDANYLAELAMKLVPKEERDIHTDFYAQKIRDELERRLPGVKVTSAPVSFFGGADQDPITIYFSGTSKEEVMGYAQKALAEIKKVQGTLEAKLTIEEGTPEVMVNVDRERMAALGLNLQMVGATMQTAFNGNTDAKFRADGKEYDIQVRMDDFNRNSVSDISKLTVLNTRGQLIRLDQFAEIKSSTGPNQLERKERQPSVTLVSKVLGRASGEVGTDIRAIFAEKLPPPSGISISYDADMKNQEEGFGSLGLAFLASILFVYLILVALYDSWLDPIVVSVSIPVAIIGSLLAMALTLSILDIFSMLGIIMMVGLVAKNAILLVDFANQAKAEGKNTHDALVEAGVTRLRPILMTTLSMAIGFLPIALASGAAAEWKNGLAWALIGGLLSSMLFSLLVIPVTYLMTDGFRRAVKRLFGLA